MRQAINTVEAKNRLNELIAKVERSHVPIVIKRRGEPVAVLLDYRSYSVKEKRQGKRVVTDTLMQEFKNLHKELRRRHPQGTGNSADLLREMRDERS